MKPFLLALLVMMMCGECLALSPIREVEQRDYKFPITREVVLRQETIDYLLRQPSKEPKQTIINGSETFVTLDAKMDLVAYLSTGYVVVGINIQTGQRFMAHAEPVQYRKKVVLERADPERARYFYLSNLLETIDSPDWRVIMIVGERSTHTETYITPEEILERLRNKVGPQNVQYDTREFTKIITLIGDTTEIKYRVPNSKMPTMAYPMTLDWWQETSRCP